MTTTDTTPDPGHGLDHAVLVAALHRRIDTAVAGHRAADQKAGLLLAVLGVSVPALARLPTGAAVAAGAGMAVTGVLLVLVVLPRTGGSARPVHDPDTALRLIAEREAPRALAAEHERLGRITTGKYRLIRAALLVLALTTAVAVIAAATG
ncbi:hypothetical protein [Embleya sp. NPDC050493]|uniref:hypothetical protein n=1 Tax=Embleya sp. NPDC050493 TaxID=3363989 RepID=UPI0037BCBA11